MAGTAQRRELRGRDVLHLVDEDRDADAQVTCEVRDVGEQLDEVELEVAGVRAAADRRHVRGWLPADTQAVAERGAHREGLEHPGDRVDPLGIPVPVSDLPDRGVQGLGQRQTQGLVRARLQLPGAPGPLHRQAAECVQQHGLADAPESGQHHRAFGPPGGHTFEGDLELAQLAVTAGQLGRSLAGTGGVRVPDRVHARTVSRCLALTLDFASES